MAIAVTRPLTGFTTEKVWPLLIGAGPIGVQLLVTAAVVTPLSVDIIVASAEVARDVLPIFICCCFSCCSNCEARGRAIASAYPVGLPYRAAY